MQRFYTRIAQALFIFICGVVVYGCNTINPKEKIPTYIHIDSFTFLDNPSVPGVSRSHNINNVFVYYNGYSVGAFDLPCTIPVTTSGESGKLQIAPGITINGLNDLLGVYPFYQYDTTTLITQPGKIVNLSPKTSYYSNARVTKISDFESAVNFYLWMGNKPLIKTTVDSLVFEGFGSGLIQLTAIGDSSIDSSTTTPFYIQPGQSSYIEFNYKSEVPFFVGLQANLSNIVASTPYFIAGIAPSDHWQKFYLNPAEFVGKAQATSYVFYIKAVLGNGQTRGKLQIDNIQLVSF